MDGKTLIFIAAVTAVRAALAAALELHPDEAYYWTWSRILAAGYFDHPPMAAYLIRLTTLVSQGEFWVRLSGLAAGIGASALIYRLSFEIYKSARAAFWSVLVLNVLPLTAAGFVMTPDVPSFFFWALALWFFRRVSSSEVPASAPMWLLTGAVCGLALLSKYTSALFAPCALLYLVLSPVARKHLKTAGPYLAAIAALAVFTPVILWNMSNGWASFAFQWEHGVGSGGKWSNVIQYVLGQAANGGLFLFPAGFYAASKAFFSENEGEIFLASFCVPVFLFFGWASFGKLGETNWPAPAFFAMSSLTAGWAFSENKTGSARTIFTKFAAGFSAVLSILLVIHALFGSLSPASLDEKTSLMDPLNRFRGWRAFAAEIEKTAAGAPVVAIDYQSASALLYYSRMRLDVRAGTNQFPFWGRNAAVDGRCVAFDYFTDVYSGPVEPSKFGKISKARAFPVSFRGRVIRTYNIYECYGFRGF